MNKYLPFISDVKLTEEVKRITESIRRLKEDTKRDVYKNALDPFSALFDVYSDNSDFTAWFQKEASRQFQKSLQNKVGEFHQNILGSCIDWEIVDNVIDIESKTKKIIAEIKNKHNTTKGSDKNGLYNNLSVFLSYPEYDGFTGYYVEIIPQKPIRYDKPFSPSDHISKKHGEIREDIRIIDGASFYELATGNHDALWQLYNAIPVVIEDLYNIGFTNVKNSPLYSELFQKTFQ